jgi:CheY-like chemotaxis protein
MSRLSGISVLLIEDHEDTRDVNMLLLQRLGARVTVAENGAEGFAKILEDCPDLVLCDLTMPVMDGIEFAKKVRRTPECAHVRLVALTAERDERFYMRAWAAGFDAYLEKPATPEALEALAARFLSGPGAPPP